MTDLIITMTTVVTTDLETHQDIVMEKMIVVGIDEGHMVIIATKMTEENKRSNKRKKKSNLLKTFLFIELILFQKKVIP